MMKLYFLVPQDCSGKVRWLLNELGESFEDVKLDWKSGDLATETYLKKHPVGQVPVLEDGAITLYESYAIVMYLADKYPERKLAPAVGDLEARAEYYQWLYFSCNTAEDFFSRYGKIPKMNEEDKENWAAYIEEKTLQVLSTINTQLQGRDYILGDFSAVDTCLGYALASVSKETFFENYPAVKNYYGRLSARSACQKSGMFNE